MHLRMKLYGLQIHVGVYQNHRPGNEEVSDRCGAQAKFKRKYLGENYDKSIAYYSDTIFHDNSLPKKGGG